MPKTNANKFLWTAQSGDWVAAQTGKPEAEQWCVHYQGMGRQRTTWLPLPRERGAKDTTDYHQGRGVLKNNMATTTKREGEAKEQKRIILLLWEFFWWNPTTHNFLKEERIWERDPFVSLFNANNFFPFLFWVVSVWLKLTTHKDTTTGLTGFHHPDKTFKSVRNSFLRHTITSFFSKDPWNILKTWHTRSDVGIFYQREGVPVVFTCPSFLMCTRFDNCNTFCPRLAFKMSLLHHWFSCSILQRALFMAKVFLARNDATTNAYWYEKNSRLYFVQTFVPFCHIWHCNFSSLTFSGQHIFHAYTFQFILTFFHARKRYNLWLLFACNLAEKLKRNPEMNDKETHPPPMFSVVLWLLLSFQFLLTKMGPFQQMTKQNTTECLSHALNNIRTERKGQQI